MPIYVYRCSNCGHSQDVLQKISDPVLTHCPACEKDSFEKQVTAASFRLKGTGWYETDFKGGSKPQDAAPAAGEGGKSTEGSKAGGDTAAASTSTAAAGGTASAAGAAAGPAAAPAGS